MLFECKRKTPLKKSNIVIKMSEGLLELFIFLNLKRDFELKH